jgi:ketosteroid isomerase-like protein
MSTANAELVRRFYESWNRQDVDAALECVHAEIEFDWSDSRSPFSGIYRGREEMRRFWTENWDTWDRFTLELEDVTDCGHGRLVTATLVRGRGKGSGVEVEAKGAMLWTVRDQKILRGKLFQSTEEALAAAKSEA